MIQHSVKQNAIEIEKGMIKLERVQRRATKLIPNIANLTYQERLRRLNLTTLEDR